MPDPEQSIEARFEELYHRANENFINIDKVLGQLNARIDDIYSQLESVRKESNEKFYRIRDGRCPAAKHERGRSCEHCVTDEGNP
ncbi:MAG: hypothetical protein HYW25_01260 [Candidatus Aenigmarchaeota archaeon]|nr:hypothetical protein [Candidatus Aenigmarchaeota archaeon]